MKKHKNVLQHSYADLTFEPATEIEMKALGDNLPEGFIAGWASTPELDTYDHIVETGAFDESILTKGLTGPRGVKLLCGHNWEKIGGKILTLETKGRRLWMTGQMNLSISYVNDLYLAAKDNGGLSFSVGFRLLDYLFKVNPTTKKEYMLITKGELLEISIVPFPGNESCEMTFIKSATPNTIAEFEKGLIAQGLAKSRNEAKRITLAVKTAAALFAGDDEQELDPAVIPVEVNKAPSVASIVQLNTLSALIADMKAAITPVVKS